MKVHELIAKLMTCTSGYDVVLANVEELGDSNEQFQIKLDQPINQVFQDSNEKKILLFTTNSKIELKQEGVFEIQTVMCQRIRESMGDPPISLSTLYAEPIIVEPELKTFQQKTSKEIAADQMRKEVA